MSFRHRLPCYNTAMRCVTRFTRFLCLITQSLLCVGNEANVRCIQSHFTVTPEHLYLDHCAFLSYRGVCTKIVCNRVRLTDPTYTDSIFICGPLPRLHFKKKAAQTRHNTPIPSPRGVYCKTLDLPLM